MLRAEAATSLTGLMALMGEDPRLRFKSPSLRTTGGLQGDTLYMRGVLEQEYRANLDLPISSLFGSGATLTVTDPAVPSHINVIVDYAATDAAMAIG